MFRVFSETVAKITTVTDTPVDNAIEDVDKEQKQQHLQSMQNLQKANTECQKLRKKI